MSERVNGLEHPYSITEYTHLALYCFANTQVSTALKLLYRARYLALLVCGGEPPPSSPSSTLKHRAHPRRRGVRYLTQVPKKALALNQKYHGGRA